ncbi:hypothetical protein BCh11DRAFT_06376 [Burkholderia sp. Ch1-1]|nr:MULTISPECIES: hypothetical protein [Paraburkholderia]EIF30867.1 hypothetical protein BCh11DRAFT_06376 [Burkholderia sp. Ch1-1]
MQSQIMMMGFLAVSTLVTIAMFGRTPQRRAVLKRATVRRGGQ